MRGEVGTQKPAQYIIMVQHLIKTGKLTEHFKNQKLLVCPISSL